MSDRRSILLLCHTQRREASNVAQHIDALRRHSRHDVAPFDPVNRPDACALLDLDEFDAVVIHYSVSVVLAGYLPEVLREKLAAFAGLKAQFIQDEYRVIELVRRRIDELGVTLLFTCVPEREAGEVYGGLAGLTTVTTLPGYVPDTLERRAATPLAERQLDVGYRGRTVPYWLGRLGQEKVQIGAGFAERAPAYGLRVDISSREGDRIYGEDWYRFLGSCRATLGTESGASIADFDGSVEHAVKGYLLRRPGASFEEVEQAVLAPYEGNVVINTVSPRVFEAAALRTAMVLFPGEYSGTVEPWVHYLPLEKDFSNMDEVVERIRDVRGLEELAERAYEDVIASGRWSLSRFVTEFDERITELSARSTRPTPAPRRLPPRVAPAVDPDGKRAAIRLVAGKVAQPPLMAALTVRDPAVRRLAAAAARKGRGGPALANDLWRLAALRRGVRIGLFSAFASLENSDQHYVITTGPTAGDAAAKGVEELAEALESGCVDEMIWNRARA